GASASLAPWPRSGGCARVRPRGGLAQVRPDRGVDRQDCVLVLDENAEGGILLFADWRFQHLLLGLPRLGLALLRRVLVFGFLWLFIRAQLFDPQSCLRNVHVEAVRIFLNRTPYGLPYTTRNNMENPDANYFGWRRNSVVKT